MKVKLFHNEIEVKDWYTDMEKYIRDYKHLIGCETTPTTCFGSYVNQQRYFEVTPSLLENLKFYLDDETLGTYKEYMQLHYPEYEHVWRYQL